MKKNFTNKLAEEQSPYLLQHAANPIDWWPWSEQAFEEAKRFNKPILLSIGYSTCHWCHVMAHESFEDQEVAEVINRVFICIKVDREERPDIDSVYMKVCLMLTGSGGWPLTIMMNHEKKPFFAGTYIPKHSKFGRTGIMELAEKVDRVWQNSPDQIISSADKVIAALNQDNNAPSGELQETIFDKCFNHLNANFDERYGGFGDAPKFPSVQTLLFLLRYHNRTKNVQALQIVENTLKNMRLGGIYDHVGDGFHRYSTDRQWLVPHFEKMLYDQAMNAIAYLETYQLTKNTTYSEAAVSIFDYIERALTDSNGGFYCAEDADSEGQEGKFYIWSTTEIKNILEDNEISELFINIYNMTDHGNYFEETTGEATGYNIPHLTEELDNYAAKLNMPKQQLHEKISLIKSKLYAAREKRIHPSKDTKIITDWNGLALAALARGAAVLDQNRYYNSAVKAADNIFSHMLKSDGRLLHSSGNSSSPIKAMLDDYAYFIWGMLELYEAGFETKYLQHAVELTDIMLNDFADKENGGFFQTAQNAEKLIVRNKEFYDGAIPSGNSVALYNLLRLGRITGNNHYNDFADKTHKVFAHQVSNTPAGFCFFLSALDFAFGPNTDISIITTENTKTAAEFIRKVQNKYIPNKSFTCVSQDELEKIKTIAPHLQSQTAINNQTTAYICINEKCLEPTTKPDELNTILSLNTLVADSD